MHLKYLHQAKDDSTFVCASFDHPKVRNPPHGDNLLFYYLRKYSYYNETIYESRKINVNTYEANNIAQGVLMKYGLFYATISTYFNY